jgi:hypothetical protein
VVVVAVWMCRPSAHPPAAVLLPTDGPSLPGLSLLRFIFGLLAPEVLAVQGSRLLLTGQEEAEADREEYLLLELPQMNLVLLRLSSSVREEAAGLQGRPTQAPTAEARALTLLFLSLSQLEEVRQSTRTGHPFLFSTKSPSEQVPEEPLLLV